MNISPILFSTRAVQVLRGKCCALQYHLFISPLLMVILIAHLLLAHFTPSLVHADLLDAVVASVDNVPITLTDVVERARIEYPSSLSDAAQSESVQAALQQIISEHLLRAESRERRIDVSDDEINIYVSRLAEQNGLSRPEFERALNKQNATIEQLKAQVEIDILRTKLANQIMREGTSVGEQEIDEYLSEHPEFTSSGAKMKLRQIVLYRDRISLQEAQETFSAVTGRISTLQDFQREASQISHGPESSDGGLLGVLSEEELHGAIFDALFTLPEQTVSPLIETSVGFHLFFIENRFLDSTGVPERKDLRAEVRAQLEEKKLQERMTLYFARELTTKFAVDKKI
ncbi:MAG: peptidylprolyl isomerase [Bdellovibrionota bacterium]